MINPTKDQIKEIADDLDCGMRCFYNKVTGEIKAIPDYESMIYADESLFEEDLNDLDENWSDYFEFEKYPSHESFQVMVDFAESVDNVKLQDRLFNALNRSKPFRNFKWQIDNSGEYRELWFAYKRDRYINFVKKQIERLNRHEERLREENNEMAKD